MRTRTTLIFILALLLFGLFRTVQAVPGGCPIEGATPMNIGPINPQNGFPLTVQDSTGLTVEMCLDPTLCISDPPIEGNAFSEQIGFGAEGFWASADAEIVTTAGLDAQLITAVEAAFNTETPIDGDQFPFTRLRLRIDIPFAGIYTVTHPWGREVYTITTPDRRAVNESFDIQFFANSVHQGRIGPLLRWDTFGQATGAPPAGFIGDPNLPHAVTGSPCGTNFFRIEAVGLDGTTPLAIDPADIDGDGRTDRVTETLFTVSGKVFTGVAPAPLVVNRTTYARQTGNSGQVDAFATSAPTAAVTVSGGPNLPAGELPLVSGQNGLFFASIPLADASTLPATVNVTANNTGNDPNSLISPLTDAVNITRAEYNVTSQTLTIEATSSDQATSPVLTASGFGDLINGSLTVPNVLAPPAKVTVTSAAGGSDSEFVTVIPANGGSTNSASINSGSANRETLDHGRDDRSSPDSESSR